CRVNKFDRSIWLQHKALFYSGGTPVVDLVRREFKLHIEVAVDRGAPLQKHTLERVRRVKDEFAQGVVIGRHDYRLGGFPLKRRASAGAATFAPCPRGALLLGRLQTNRRVFFFRTDIDVSSIARRAAARWRRRRLAPDAARRAVVQRDALRTARRSG